MKRPTSLISGRPSRIVWVSALALISATAVACANVWGFKDFQEDTPAVTDDATAPPGPTDDAADAGTVSGFDAPSGTNDAEAGGPLCPPQEALCGDSGCQSILIDPHHCGVACIDCPLRYQTCTAGECVCAPGTHLCHGICAMDTDPDNCGASCTVCMKSATATRSCAGGSCTFTCPPPLAPGSPPLTVCPTDTTSVECFDLTTNTAHCGSCNTACPTPSHSVATSCGGTPAKCSLTCEQGYTECGSDGGSPSCAYLMTEPLNCGSCGHACPGSDAGKGFCVNGVCQ